MTHVERRKHIDTFHFITWLQKQINHRLTVLVCSDHTPHNHGARMVLEDLKRTVELKRQSIIATGSIGR